MVSSFNQQRLYDVVRPLMRFHTTSRKNQNHHQATKSSDNNISDDEVTFEVQSLDRQGQWMSIDYNSIPIEKLQYDNKHSQDNNNNNNSNKLQNVFAPIQPSPIETKLINDKIIYIKRDDLLHLRNSNVSGNKARKMLALNELSVEQFPDVVVSYGGPQSNAMVALAAIVQSKNDSQLIDNDEDNTNSDGSNENNIDEIESDRWIMKDDRNNDYHDDDNDEDNEEIHNVNDLLSQNASNSNQFRKKRFIYYTKKLPRYLRNQPNGNLLRALTLGMEMVQLKPDTYNQLFGGYEGGSAISPIDAPVKGSSLWVPQGGACGLATQGAKYMAEEILSFWVNNGKGRPLSVCVPGGTCTTAMLLSRELNSKIRKIWKANNDDNDVERIDIEVVVIPCVGDEDYASRQMKALDRSLGGNGRDGIPRILKPIKRKRYFRFGEPNAAILETYHEMMNEHGLFLDLLYGAPAWNVLLEHLDFDDDGENNNNPIQGRQVMYVHSGGLEGVSSQLKRYKHQGLVDSTEVQN